ncbi:MAG: protein-glutamate methylesterase/protein-glutamine glutaminase [Desulfovermiculus sp.]
MSTKVLVVDDTIFYRKVLKDILSSIPDVEVVGTANNGKVALSRIKAFKPDLLTLDVEMPEMNGLEVLQEIQRQGYDVECLMVSSLTQTGSNITVQALSMGALDFIAKPDSGSNQENTALLKKAIEPKMRAFHRRRELKNLLKGKTPPSGATVSQKDVQDFQTVISRSKAASARTEKSRAVALGVSTGGPNALSKVIPQLPATLNVPVFLVQHMPKTFTASLAQVLDKNSALQVKEAQNGEAVRPNVVYIAPGGQQMKIASGAQGQIIVRVTDDPPENNCKPSVDYLFRSVAREYGSKATAVILTGMGSDGKQGVKVMKSAGAMSIAQNAATCVVYGMPKAIVDAGLADIVAPLEDISKEIAKTV